MAVVENESEDALLARAQAGEEPAVRRLLLQHEETMRRAIRQVLRRRTAGWIDEDDVYQEAVLALVTSGLRRFRRTCAVRTFLCVVARHKAIDVLRKFVHPADDPRSARPLDEDSATAKEWDAGDSERVAFHLAVFANLEPRCRDLLYKRFAEERKPREIAADIGTRPNTVSQAVGRCIARFRALLAGASTRGAS